MNYKSTLIAGYTGYIVQAIVNNLAPLLFVIFNRELGLSLVQLSSLAAINFAVQTAVDFISAALADKAGYRKMMLTSHGFVIAGLCGLSLFPSVMPAYPGIICAVVLYAVGGGIIEVIVSPLIEALPLENKASAMSLLHSFYCWGQVAVVLLSTLFIYMAGSGAWRILPLLWTAVPLFNMVLLTKVPILQLNSEAAPSEKKFISTGSFWLFALIMVCAGASELGMSQWASAFAEESLNLSKAAGDIFGPCMFALLMGLARWFYGRFGDKIPLEKFMLVCALGCVGSYLLSALSPAPVFALAGCGICGLCVGIMWPGTFSMAGRTLPSGGTAMFALLAFAGDVGCASGPSAVGLAGSIRGGLLIAAVFPAVLAAAVWLNMRIEKKGQ